MLEHPHLVDPDERERHLARSKVSRAASEGTSPHANWSESDLQWAFGNGHEDRLAELEQVAADILEKRQAAAAASARRTELHSVTESVLREWDRLEKHERRVRAQAEAERRIAEAAK